MSKRMQVAIVWFFICLGLMSAFLMLPSYYGYDKVIHAGAYTLFAIVTCWLLDVWLLDTVFKLLICIMVLIVASFASELMQFFLPGRIVDVYDIVANIVGSILGFLLYKFL